MAKELVPKIEAHNLSFHYGETEALDRIFLSIPRNRVTALIEPSGCGKSTFLRTLNRMNKTIENARHEGEVLLDGTEIYRRGIDVVEIRKRIGIDIRDRSISSKNRCVPVW